MAGPSMLPTLDNSGELVLESILPHRLFPNQLGRGELITLTSPVDPSRIICKRVIGLPGDVVCVDPTGIKAHSTEHVVVPKGHIWVAGDNAAWSKDSRDYGPVSMALVRGRIAARIYPFNRFTVFSKNTTYIEH
jgi:inner membrane protease subunit 1